MRVLLINLLIVTLFVWSGEMQGEVTQDQQSDNIVCSEEYGMILFAIKKHAHFEKSRTQFNFFLSLACHYTGNKLI